LIVGALAVSWHGFPRYSADVDFLVRPSQTNAARVLRALSQFGFRSLDISASDLTSTGKVIQLGYEPNRIDLMTSLTGVSFDDAWKDRAAGDPDGLRGSFIDRLSLLRNKDATGRAKDRIERGGTPEAEAVNLVYAREYIRSLRAAAAPTNFLKKRQ
jgi:hypothetical protein